MTAAAALRAKGAKKAPKLPLDWKAIALDSRVKAKALLDVVIEAEDDSEVFFQLTTLAAEILEDLEITADNIDDVARAYFRVGALITGALHAPVESPPVAESSRTVLRIASQIVEAAAFCFTTEPRAQYVANYQAMATSAGAAPDSAASAESLFLTGRDAAVEMLEEAHGIVGASSQCAAPRRWARAGRAQENFVFGWIADAIPDRQVLRGFCAVLSAYLSTADTYFPEALALPYAEFQAGDIGADGTMPTPDWVNADAAVTKVGADSTRPEQ